VRQLENGATAEKITKVCLSPASFPEWFGLELARIVVDECLGTRSI
jgi:hypothetical protein